MKWSCTSGIKCVGIACIAVLMLIGLYYVSVPALDARRIANIHPDYSEGSGHQVEARAATVACDLPAGWQADWRSDLLQITHYNSNGTVADSLSFASHEELDNWAETHPDFCDVNLKKLALQELDIVMPKTDAVAESVAPNVSDTGKAVAMK